MNVLMISDVYFPRINGVSTSIQTFRSELHALGTETTLIAPTYPADAQAEEASVLRVASRYLPMDPEDRMMKRGEIRRHLRALRERRFDIVHIQTPFVAHYAGLELARELGVPAIASYHTYFEEYLYHYVPFLPREWLRGMARRFSRSQCNALDALVVPSRAMAEALGQYGVTRPLHILPTGLPADRFAGGDGHFFRSRYQIPNDRPLMLFVGRVAFEKNISFLIDVADRVRHQMPQAMLLVTGEGPALPELHNQVESRGLQEHVRFLGYLDRRQELHDCYRAADVFVFASRTETQGLVLLEAMALGLPAVALSVMGTRDILEHARGAIVARDDVEDFAAQVLGILRDPVQRRQLGQEARAYARERWGAETMARQMQALYSNVCAGHPEKAPEEEKSQHIAAG